MDFRNVTTFAVLLLLIGGCRTQHVPYHSTASLPHYSMGVSTEMNLVGGVEDMMGSRTYAVISAVDNGTQPYVLLAPLRDGGSYRLGNAKLGRSAPLLASNTAEFIDGLSRTLLLWDQVPQGEEGVFYEFTHAPEQDIIPVSQNVVEWEPTVRFTFSHTTDGPSARLLIGYHPTEDKYMSVITMKKRKEVADLKQLLEEAMMQMDAMAGQATR